MRRRKWFAKTIALVMAAALLPLPQGTASVKAEEGAGEAAGQAVQAAQGTSVPRPDYLWDFENVDGNSAGSTGTVSGAATLHGAQAAEGAVAIGGNTYSKPGNKVLNLTGGNKGTSYADLPENLYEGVSADTGLTWSFWMKADADVVSYSRLFSSADNKNKNEFAFTPYAKDKMWNVIFDDEPNKYRLKYSAEPEKGVWNYITIAISGDEAVLYVNGDESQSELLEGSADSLKKRLDALSAFTNHALGKTVSTWTDKDCAVQLDDVALYKAALTSGQVAELARSYGLQPMGPREPQDAQEGLYGQGKKQLAMVQGLTVSSVDNANQVKVWKDEGNRYYYSVSRNGKVVIECSALGITTTAADFTFGMELVPGSIQTRQGREKYETLQGSSSKVDKEYRELSFTLKKGNGNVTIYFRVFNDGMAYRYEVDADTASEGETTTVTGEASEFVLPDKGDIWTINTSNTYEGRDYTKRTMESQYDAAAEYSTPILASLSADSGNAWVLLSEANVYNEEKPYCGSVFKTQAGEKSFQVVFGKYLKQETNPSYDKKRYTPEYGYIKEVQMEGTFHTPWRTAVIASDLEGVANSSLFTDLNPQPAKDFSWVEPGASVWSWWSSSYDAIEYKTMQDYIDFSAEAGIKYCLVDYGWELWDDYKTKIAQLVKYGEERGVSLLVWYGVNKFDGDHIFDLDSREAIEEQFAWCEEVGVKGVKVDYINSASPFAMNVMYLLADIAADHHLVLNYHGCINPSGENRTYPNILSSEAVAGMENYKWNNGPGVATLLTLPYTRNVLGSMEFTPTAYRVHNSDATAGLMLAHAVVYESAVQTFAHSAYVYQGYNGLSLISDVPTTWDESRLLEGYPGESVVRARRKGANWYLGAMSLPAKTYEVPLNFLDAGATYHAYIYKDNAAGDDIEIETKEVTSQTVLSLPLLANGGCSVKFTKTEPLKQTVYDNYNYYEAEDTAYASLGGSAVIEEKQYASKWKIAGYLGNGGTLTFHNMKAKAAGEYELKLYFVSGESRDLYLKVNDGEPIGLKGLIGYPKDWGAVAGLSIPVQLQEGDNTIHFYNDTGAAPSIDRVGISKLDISDAQISLSQGSYVYNGKDCTPKATVTIRGVKLEEGVDFNVSYKGNRNAGTAQAVITGIGGCTGTASKPFQINKKQAAITGKAKYDKAYGAKAFTLGVSSTAGKEGKLSYASDNTKVAKVSSAGKVTLVSTGQAAITVKLSSNNYTAKAYKVKIQVRPSKVALSSARSKKAKQVSVAWKKLSAKQKISGYQVSRSLKKNFKGARNSYVTKNAKSAVIKKLKSKKQYYVRVRAYTKVGKTKLYGDWSKAKKVKVK